MYYSLTEYGFVTYVLFVTVFMLMVFLVTELIGRLFRNSKQGYAPYVIIFAFIAAMTPFRHKLLPAIIDIKQFDSVIWVGEGDHPKFLTISMLMIGLWITGTAVSLLVEIMRYIRLASEIGKTAIPCKDNRVILVMNELCKNRPIPVYICTNFSTPFAMGLFRPKIILPSSEYTDEEMRLVLIHEITHIKRKDILAKSLLVLFRAFNWFNPIVYMICRRTFENMEISVDESVAKTCSENDKIIYSKLIVKTAAGFKMSDCTTYLSLKGRGLKRRISSIIENKNSSLIPTALMAIGVFGVSLLITPSNEVYANTWGMYGCLHLVEYYDNGERIYPFPDENDPVTFAAESYKEAAQQYFELLFMNRTGENVPEYDRIEQYAILGADEFPAECMGMINSLDTRIIQMNVAYETANKCGNTIYDFPFPFYTFNGLYKNICYVKVKLTENQENLGQGLHNYEIIGVGDAGYVGSETIYGTGGHRYIDFTREIENYYGILAENGLLDKDCADSETINEEIQKLRNAGCFNNSDTAGLFEFCGYKADLWDNVIYIYGNVYTKAPHGVIINCSATDGLVLSYHGTGNQRITVACTEMFDSIEYHDSFSDIKEGDISYEPTAENAEALLKYMMTPRDGTDFTVLAYKNITVKDSAVYADVRFKGRLEGVYSESRYIDEHGGENEWYMPDVRII